MIEDSAARDDRNARVGAMPRDWVTLASAVLEEGVKGPGASAGVVAGLASTALEPEKGRLCDWREEKAQLKAFVKSLQDYGRRRGFGDADVEDGMASARTSFGRRARGEIAEFNLLPLVTTRSGARWGPVSQQALGPDTRAVCKYAVEDFQRECPPIRASVRGHGRTAAVAGDVSRRRGWGGEADDRARSACS